MTVETTLSDSAGNLIAQHPLTYHLERHIKGAGWALALTFPSRGRQFVHAHSPGFAPEGLELGRVENDGDGTPLKLYDGLGRPISLTELQARAGTTAAPRRAASMAARLKAAATAAGMVSRRASTDKTWSDFFVLQPADNARRMAALRQRYGIPHRNTNGKDEYTWRHDSTTTTVEADPLTHVVVGETDQVGGEMRRQWTVIYESQPDGSSIRREMRVTAPVTAHSPQSRTTVTRYSNIQFTKG